MGLGEFIEGNRNLVLGIVFFVLIVAGVRIGLTSFGGKKVGAYQRYYYDLDEGAIIEYSSMDPPPVTLDNGHTAVVAHMYGCGGCTGERFLGFLDRYDPAISQKQRMESDRPSWGAQIALDPALTDGQVEWYDRDSRDGMDILGMPRQKCQGRQYARECFPGR